MAIAQVDSDRPRSAGRWRRFLFVLITGLLGVFYASCQRAAPGPLRVGIKAWPGYELLYLAQEKGFFQEQGVPVRIIEFSSLSDARRAYERGQVDALGTTVIEVLQARDNSRRSPQIVQVVDYSDGADLILAQAGLTNLTQLKGKRVGVELASLGVYILAVALERRGLSLTNVVAVSLDQGSMEEAFLKGELEAIVTYPPTSTKLARGTKASTLFTTAEIPGEVIDVIAVEAEVVQSRPQAIRGVVQAYRQAHHYARQNPAEACRIMALREGITPQEFYEAWTTGMTMVGPEQQVDYLRAGGKMAAVVGRTERILREARQIHGPDRRGDCFTEAFATLEAGRP